MTTETFISELNRLPVWYGKNVEEIRNLFSRKEQQISKKDSQFFSQYWQVFAWAAIIGFLHDKRIDDAELVNKTSIPAFKTIYNNGEDIGQALILMAISKIKSDNPEDILKPRKILNIIGEYAEGGARYILELRESSENNTLFDHPDDYLMEIYQRTQSAE